ncbi:hypothetical protein DMUE_1539 [Dictyocoela muelleri]|nr:hypothetical protein DMUE_1539 [Dictyocoela muelleri]
MQGGVYNNEKCCKTIRFIYANFKEEISDDESLFIDESGFNILLTKKYGYSKEKSQSIHEVPNSKGSNVFILCTISVVCIYCFKVKIVCFKAFNLFDFISNELSLL